MEALSIYSLTMGRGVGKAAHRYVLQTLVLTQQKITNLCEVKYRESSALYFAVWYVHTLLYVLVLWKIL